MTICVVAFLSSGSTAVANLSRLHTLGRTAQVADVALKAKGRSNHVLAVALTKGYFDMFSAQLCGARRNGVDNIMVLAFDKESAEFARQNGVPVATGPGEKLAVSGESEYGTVSFQRVMLYRLRMLRAIAASGVNVVTMDTDVIPMSPLMKPRITRLFEKFQMFGQANSGGLFGISGGFIAIAGNVEGTATLDRVIACHSRNIQTLEHLIATKYHDGKFPIDSVYAPLTEQVCFNDEFNKLPLNRRHVEWNILDGNRVYLKNETFNPEVHYAIHNNYAIGEQGKIDRMKSYGFWPCE